MHDELSLDWCRDVLMQYLSVTQISSHWSPCTACHLNRKLPPPPPPTLRFLGFLRPCSVENEECHRDQFDIGGSEWLRLLKKGENAPSFKMEPKHFRSHNWSNSIFVRINMSIFSFPKTTLRYILEFKSRPGPVFWQCCTILWLVEKLVEGWNLLLHCQLGKIYSS